MSAPAPPPRQPVDAADLTARARIRDAAIIRFAADGVAATTLKAIAVDAGVSTPLVAHHFGSKEGLRAACDEYVAARIRVGKHATLTGGLDPLSGLRQVGEGPPLLRYLARTVADGSAHVAALLDELVDDAVEYLAQGVEHGLLTPTERPRERAAVLILWQFGALALHAHVKRLIGADLMSDDPADFASWAVAAGEILTHGVITEALFAQLREAAETLASERDTEGRQR